MEIMKVEIEIPEKFKEIVNIVISNGFFISIQKYFEYIIETELTSRLDDFKNGGINSLIESL